MDGNNAVGFDYQGVQNVKEQVATVNIEVQELFRRVDSAIQENIGEGTSFYGKKAEAFKQAWENAKATFPNYTSKITAICNSAQTAGGIYSENENAGTIPQL